MPARQVLFTITFVAFAWTAICAQGNKGVQLRYLLNAEAGWSIARFSGNKAAVSPLLRFQGKLGVQQKKTRHFWQFSAQLRPEYYLDAAIPSLNRLTFSGSYRRNYSRWRWQVAADADRRRLSFSPGPLRIASQSIGVDILWQHRPKTQFLVRLAYLDYHNQGLIENSLIGAQLTVGWQRLYGRTNRFLLNIMAEPFSIGQPGMAAKNAGWRWGAGASFNHQQRWVLRGSYRWTWHTSDLTKSPSMEHLLSCLAGRIFLQHWTFLLLADYHFRNFTIVPHAAPMLLYTTMDENRRIFVKLERDLTAGRQLYALFGYQREEFLGSLRPLAGWRFMLGLSIRN